MARTRGKPGADFVVRLAGSGIRPWLVPMRMLAKVLDAVQRLVEPGDDDDLVAEKKKDGGRPLDEASVLHLVDVKNASAAYAVAVPDRLSAISALASIGRSISEPVQAGWTESTLSSLRDLSDVARSLECEIEFLTTGDNGRPGEVVAKVTPGTYGEVSASAFVRGQTTILARIERVGGATAMRCGIRLPDSPRRMVFCRVASTGLVRQLGQYLYQHVVVSGRATWLKRDWRLIRLVIESFEPPKTGSVMNVLRQAHDAGGDAWDKVDDPGAFIAEMRRS